MNHSQSFGKNLHLRVPFAVHEKLIHLKQATGQSQNALAVEALESFFDMQAWRKAEIQAGLAEADRSEFATPDEMNAIFAQYANKVD